MGGIGGNVVGCVSLLTVRLLIYLVMSLAFMVAALIACHLIKEDPESNKPWLIAAPALVLAVVLLVVMFHDLLS